MRRSLMGEEGGRKERALVGPSLSLSLSRLTSLMGAVSEFIVIILRYWDGQMTHQRAPY